MFVLQEREGEREKGEREMQRTRFRANDNKQMVFLTLHNVTCLLFNLLVFENHPELLNTLRFFSLKNVKPKIWVFDKLSLF